MPNKQKLSAYNCFLDLQRAATCFYLNPQGKTHQVFLNHAKKILRNIKGKNSKLLSNKLSKISREAFPSKSKTKSQNLADHILTLGILLKPPI